MCSAAPRADGDQGLSVSEENKERRSGFCSVSFSQSLTEPSACIRSDGLVQSYSRSSRSAAAALSARLSELVVLAAVASS